jgi:hypothetical protein
MMSELNLAIVDSIKCYNHQTLAYICGLRPHTNINSKLICLLKKVYKLLLTHKCKNHQTLVFESNLATVESIKCYNDQTLAYICV